MIAFSVPSPSMMYLSLDARKSSQYLPIPTLPTCPEFCSKPMELSLSSSRSFPEVVNTRVSDSIERLNFPVAWMYS